MTLKYRICKLCGRTLPTARKFLCFDCARDAREMARQDEEREADARDVDAELRAPRKGDA